MITFYNESTQEDLYFILFVDFIQEVLPSAVGTYKKLTGRNVDVQMDTENYISAEL